MVPSAKPVIKRSYVLNGIDIKNDRSDVDCEGHIRSVMIRFPGAENPKKIISKLFTSVDVFPAQPPA